MIKPIYKSVDQPLRLARMMLGLPVTQQNNIGTVPFGYTKGKLNEETKHYQLDPVDSEFQFLVEAKYLLFKHSLRDVATWLHSRTGRKISHFGLQKLMYTRRPMDESATKSLEEREALFLEMVKNGTL